MTGTVQHLVISASLLYSLSFNKQHCKKADGHEPPASTIAILVNLEIAPHKKDKERGRISAFHLSPSPHPSLNLDPFLNRTTNLGSEHESLAIPGRGNVTIGFSRRLVLFNKFGLGD